MAGRERGTTPLALRGSILVVGGGD
jgi:hypothetical protein